MERLHMLCRSYEIPENLIEIEITESAFIEYPQAVINMEAQIKQMGFLLSMDDFGTGYSSLSMLKDIPVDIIKLDCQFFKSKM